MSDLLERLRKRSLRSRNALDLDAYLEIERLQAERDNYRAWNESVRVCKDHTGEIVGDGCVICDLQNRQAVVDAALEDALRTYGAPTGDSVPHSDTEHQVGGEVKL